MAWFNGEWYESIADTIQVHDWCPECAPDGIPEPYTLRLCPIHTPSTDGLDDVTARGENGAFYASGTSESGGESNAQWCAILHRRVGTQQ